MSVQTVKFALKMGEKAVVFEPKSKRQMVRLVKAFLTTHGAPDRAVQVIKGIDALVSKEGMVYPSQTKQAIADRASRKSRSISALDCAMFVKSLPGTESLEGYNLALASFMEANNEGTDATAKTIRVAGGEGAEYPVMSSDLADFAEMRKHGGQYTKAIAVSRQQRLEAAQKRKDDAEDRRSARRARADRRFKAFLERRSRGLIEAKPRSLSQAMALAIQPAVSAFRRIRRVTAKVCHDLTNAVESLVEAAGQPNPKAVVQQLTGFSWPGKRWFSEEKLNALLKKSVWRYFVDRKERKVLVNEEVEVVANLLWSGPALINMIETKVSIKIGQLLAQAIKACK